MNKGHNPSGQEKTRLKPDEKEDVEKIKEHAQDAAETEYKRLNPKLPSFTMNYARGEGPKVSSAERKRSMQAAEVTPRRFGRVPQVHTLIADFAWVAKEELGAMPIPGSEEAGPVGKRSLECADARDSQQRPLHTLKSPRKTRRRGGRCARWAWLAGMRCPRDAASTPQPLGPAGNDSSNRCHRGFPPGSMHRERSVMQWSRRRPSRLECASAPGPTAP